MSVLCWPPWRVDRSRADAALAMVVQFYSDIRQDKYETSERETNSIVSTGRESGVSRSEMQCTFFTATSCGDELGQSWVMCEMSKAMATELVMEHVQIVVSGLGVAGVV